MTDFSKSSKIEIGSFLISKGSRVCYFISEEIVENNKKMFKLINPVKMNTVWLGEVFIQLMVSAGSFEII